MESLPRARTETWLERLLVTPSVSWSSDLVGLARGLELEGGDHSVTSVLPPLLSSHNWNTLFMGPNAVADAIAQKYNATKSQVFDHVSEGALRVVYFRSVLPWGRRLDRTAAELVILGLWPGQQGCLLILLIAPPPCHRVSTVSGHRTPPQMW